MSRGRVLITGVISGGVISGIYIYLSFCRLLSRAVIKGRASAVSRHLQATWPYKMDIEAAIWSSLAKLFFVKLNRVTVF